MVRTIILFIEVVSIIFSILFGGLWINNPAGPYEPPFAVAGFVFVITEFYRRYQNKTSANKINEKDIELFEEFCELFSNNDLIRFYKEHDFLASFDRKYLEPLNSFIENWDNAAHEFADNSLENERKKLYQSAFSLGTMIAKNTVPDENGRISVKPTNLPPGPTPDWVIKDAKEINALVPPFIKLHEDFVRLGRRNLYEGKSGIQNSVKGELKIITKSKSFRPHAFLGDGRVDNKLHFTFDFDLINNRDELAMINRPEIIKIEMKNELFNKTPKGVHFKQFTDAFRPIAFPYSLRAASRLFMRCEVDILLNDNTPIPFAEKLNELTSYEVEIKFSYEDMQASTTIENREIIGTYADFKQEILDFWKGNNNLELINKATGAS